MKLILALAVVFALALPVHASDPVGIYCLVERVVFEPNNSGPATVQIWGAFSIAIPRETPGADAMKGTYGSAGTGDLYGPVQRGYMYFTCAPGQATLCRNEWNDLNRMAAAREPVGFGGRRMANGTVRSATTPVANPDRYPLNIGVVPIARFPSNYGAGSPNRTMYAGLIDALRGAIK
jgi:hypothetical protein